MNDIIFQISLRLSYDELFKISLVDKNTHKTVSRKIFWLEKFKYDFSDKIANYFICYDTNYSITNIICVYRCLLKSLNIANKILYVNNVEMNRKILGTNGSILSYICSHELLINIVPDEFYSKTKDIKFSFIDYGLDTDPDHNPDEELPEHYILIINSIKDNQYNLSFDNRGKDYIKYRNYVVTVEIDDIRDILMVLIYHEYTILDEFYERFYNPEREINVEEFGTDIITDHYNNEGNDKSLLISIMRLGIYEMIDNEKIRLF